MAPIAIQLVSPEAHMVAGIFSASYDLNVRLYRVKCSSESLWETNWVFLVLPCAASIVLCSCNLMRRQWLHSVNLCNIAWKMLLMHTCWAKLTKQWSQLCFFNSGQWTYQSYSLQPLLQFLLSLALPQHALQPADQLCSKPLRLHVYILWNPVWALGEDTSNCKRRISATAALLSTPYGPSFNTLTPPLHPVSEHMKGFKHTGRKYLRGRCQVSTSKRDRTFKCDTTRSKTTEISVPMLPVWYRKRGWSLTFPIINDLPRRFYILCSEEDSI